MKISISPASLSLALGLGRWRSSQPIAFDYGMYVALHYPLLHGLKVDEGTARLFFNMHLFFWWPSLPGAVAFEHIFTSIEVLN